MATDLAVWRWTGFTIILKTEQGFWAVLTEDDMPHGLRGLRW